MGVWIETNWKMCDKALFDVTPHVGVWIETDTIETYCEEDRSPPMWGCGLKLVVVTKVLLSLRGHPPCGGVD